MLATSGLLASARAGDKRAIARLLTVVENDAPGAPEILRETFAQTGRALVLGVTGPPGGGKSTLVSRLVGAYRARVARVAVVAVDPSSPFSGGAILGDRIRMQDRFLDEGVFIRSMASRGHSGGLARTTARVVAVLDALGTDTVIVETVGVGQEEIEVVRVVDTVALVTVPGLGDDIQAIKAGVLEIADVLVVNKADRPGADETVRDLAQMLSLGPSVRPGRALPAPGGPPSEAWKPPIVRTVAATGDGTDELVRAVDRHRAWGRDSGECDRRRADAALVEVEALLRESLVRRLEERVGSAGVKRAVERVASREVDPYTAVEELLAKYR